MTTFNCEAWLMKKYTFLFTLLLSLLASQLWFDVSMAQEVADDTLAKVNTIESFDSHIYTESLKAISALLVMAVMIENALAVIFNWRIFRTYFSLRGLKTVVMITVSFSVVHIFNIDVVAQLFKTYSLNQDAIQSDILSQILTALIVSGGSSGVHTIMRALGYRTRDQQRIFPSPGSGKAWVAVKVLPGHSVGPVFVEVSEVAQEDIRGERPKDIAGMCRTKMPSLIELLLRNKNRFPPNGGYEVTPGLVYEIWVSGFDAHGQKLRERVGEEQMSFAQNAVVDFEVVL
jgi:magnesium-transporting ATPase (P-type)